jgi:hypothetical protein
MRCLGAVEALPDAQTADLRRFKLAVNALEPAAFCRTCAGRRALAQGCCYRHFAVLAAMRWHPACPAALPDPLTLLDMVWIYGHGMSRRNALFASLFVEAFSFTALISGLPA